MGTYGYICVGEECAYMCRNICVYMSEIGGGGPVGHVMKCIMNINTPCTLHMYGVI